MGLTSLIGLMRASGSSGGIALMASSPFVVDQLIGSAKGVCVSKTGLARLRSVEDAVEDCARRDSLKLA